MARHMSWAPTIALSWLWGLGFFFSFHMTLTYGWLGFAAFAAPNAFGLFAFGWVLGDRRRNPAAIFRSVQSRFAGLFLASQVLAVAITIFASAAYLFIPLFGLASVPLMGGLALLAMAVGHATTIRQLKQVHIVYLAIGLVAAIGLAIGLMTWVPTHRIPLASFDSRFYGLMLPSLVGFLLGPWTDVQQWQRAIAIHDEGGSVRSSYGLGALLFLCLISINALIAGAAGPALVMISADGLPSLQTAVAGAIVKMGSGALVVAFAIWASVSVASTLDSFYLATRWLLVAATRESKSPILAFVPEGLVTSPIWYLLTAMLVALFGIAENLAMIFLMIAYATLFAGATACLVCEVLTGRKVYDPMLCLLIGIASVLIFTAGYLSDTPALVGVAPLVGLIGAFTAIRDVFAPRSPLLDLVSATNKSSEPGSTIAIVSDQNSPVRVGQSHGFEDQWFVMHLTPTYDDTNSVGNVYFANYFRWVGKARELMFNACMPQFDLKTTTFLVLTKSFEHDFRREVREFDPATVRLKIGSFNRKFATIHHEIYCASGLVGKGRQTIMFVDTKSFKPLDIPPIVMQSFLPYYNAPEKPMVFGPRAADHSREPVPASVSS